MLSHNYGESARRLARRPLISYLNVIRFRRTYTWKSSIINYIGPVQCLLTGLDVNLGSYKHQQALYFN